MDNIAAAATQTSELGGSLSKLAASLAISVDTIARQQQEIKIFPSRSTLLKIEGRRQPVSEHCPERRRYAHIVRWLAVRRHTGKMLATLTQRKLQTERIGLENSWMKRA